MSRISNKNGVPEKSREAHATKVAVWNSLRAFFNVSREITLPMKEWLND